MRWWMTVTALWSCGLSGAFAQSQDWLVLPATLGDETKWMKPTVDDLGRELRKQGVGVWTPGRAIAAFEARGSAPPVEVSEREVAGWVERSQDALLKLVQAQTGAALAELETAQAFSRRALETLNRDPKHARTVLDTCLYLVRAKMESKDRSAASAQARECVRMVPATKPSRQMHPPEVLALYESASEPGPRHRGELRVESQPPKCPIRVNGVLMGKTPFELSNLVPGEYRIQLECDPEARGRVHRVEVPAGGVSLFIFDSFDRAVRSEPVLHLRYEEQPVIDQLAIDARQVARALPASAIVVVSRMDAHIFNLRLITLTQIEPRLTRVMLTGDAPSSESVQAAISALLRGECIDLTGEKPVPLDCVTGQPREQNSATVSTFERVKRERHKPPHGRFVSGLTLASVGTASMLTGYGLFIARRSAGTDWLDAPSELAPQDKWLRLGTGVIATSAAGAGLLVTAMPLVLPHRAKTPWWAWLSGGLGLAATAGAVVSAATADLKPPQSCKVSGPDPTACVERGRDTDRAIVLGMTAAPLLAMPLVYLLRRSDKRIGHELEPVLAVGRGRGEVGIRGVF
ncbi:MAG: PEGA domain-containing protein [Myxococcales bacterium]